MFITDRLEPIVTKRGRLIIHEMEIGIAQALDVNDRTHRGLEIEIT